MPRGTWDTFQQSLFFRIQGSHLLWLTFPSHSPRKDFVLWKVPQPPSESEGFRLLPFRSPLLRQSHMISFPPGTWMFRFPGCPSRKKRDVLTYVRTGYPIRKPTASNGCLRPYRCFRPLASVLPRPKLPRHPPLALNSLPSFLLVYKSYLSMCRGLDRT